MPPSSQLYHSNSFIALLHLLRENLAEEFAGAPSSRLIVVTPNQLVRKHVQETLLTLSGEGVVTGFVFWEFSTAIAKLFTECLGKEPLLPSKSMLTLEIARVLEEGYRDIGEEILPETVKKYIEKNPHKRIASLSSALASFFVKCIANTLINEELFAETWQGKFFKHVIAKFDLPKTWKGETASPRIPYSLHFVGFTQIPDGYFSFLMHLRKRYPLSWYVLSPTPEYWSDQQRDESVCTLLGEYGALHKKQLNAFIDAELEPYPLFIEQKGTSALHAMKKNLQNVTAEPIEHDSSVMLYGAPGMQRIFEEVFGAIATSIVKNGGDANDFLVLIADMKSAVPIIHRTFGNAEAPLPYRIFDVPLSSLSEFHRTLLFLLQMVQGKVSSEELCILFGKESILERFRLSSKDVETIQGFFKAFHFAWGISKEHRAHILGIEEEEDAPTLESVLKLLAKGFACAQIEGVTPADAYIGFSLEALDLPLLEALCSVQEALSEMSTTLHSKKAYTLEQWETIFLRFTTLLFTEETVEEKARPFFKTLFASFEKGVGQSYSPSAVMAYITQNIEAKRGVYGGNELSAITFAPLHSDNCVAKKHIYLVGTEASSFPRAERREFFLPEKVTLTAPQEEARARSSILSAILAAEESLSIYYSSSHEEDGSRDEPSRLLAPLKLDPKSLPESRYDMPTSPMLPSTRAMHAVHTIRKKAVPFCDTLEEPFAEKPPLDKEYSLSHINRFLRHPLRAYAQKKLKLYFPFEEPSVDEKELVLPSFEKTRLSEIMQRTSVEYAIENASVRGLLPVGALKQQPLEEVILEYTEKQDSLSFFGIQKIQPILFSKHAEKVEKREKITIFPSPTINDTACTGEITSISTCGQFILPDTSLKTLFTKWAELLLFGKLFPNGKICVLSKKTYLSPPTEGLLELLEYIAYAEKHPSPLFHDTIAAVLDGDALKMEEKLLGKSEGFSAQDKYASLYFGREKNQGAALLEKWKECATAAFKPLFEWKEHG